MRGTVRFRTVGPSPKPAYGSRFSAPEGRFFSGVEFLPSRAREGARGPANEAVIVHEGDADWPYAFEARQYLALAPEGLRATLVCTNRDAAEQPG